MKKSAFVLMFMMIFAISSADLSFAGGKGGGRVYYGGGRHTTSHGGIFVGGSGSSHKGGTYVNARTGNLYGKHK
jgi:hypothetical protein